MSLGSVRASLLRSNLDRVVSESAARRDCEGFFVCRGLVGFYGGIALGLHLREEVLQV